MPHENRGVIVTGAGGSGCGGSIAARFARATALSLVVSDLDVAGATTPMRLA
jgi:D-arabinose 5-phosphate isomerase GutQ